MTSAPLLTIVTGPPCTGKSTLARRLGQETGLPVFHKDGFKEALFDRLGVRDRAWSRALSRAAFDLLFHVAQQELAGRRSLIVEGNFHPHEEGTRWRELQERHGCRAIQIVLRADPDVLRARFRARAASGERHPGHDDANNLETALAQDSTPLDLAGPVEWVETTAFDHIDIETLRGALLSS